uniref:Uncharacterized protein n=1 Tax=Arundo donax TaxID=35708 RepID=A0A0A9FRR0_ARUDO
MLRLRDEVFLCRGKHAFFFSRGEMI